jgi:hypothetical protein
MDWMYFAQDRDQWQGLMKAVVSLGDPKKGGNFFIFERLKAFHKS